MYTANQNFEPWILFMILLSFTLQGIICVNLDQFFQVMWVLAPSFWSFNSSDFINVRGVVTCGITRCYSPKGRVPVIRNTLKSIVRHLSCLECYELKLLSACFSNNPQRNNHGWRCSRVNANGKSALTWATGECLAGLDSHRSVSD